MGERQITHWEGCVKVHPNCARSDLARKVLNLVSGFSREIRKTDLEALLNDLFTREHIDLGENL